MGTSTDQVDASVIGERIQQRRAEKGWTQAQAAEAAGVAVTTWRMMERGAQDSFRTLTLVAVAKALDWPSDALLSGEAPETIAREKRDPHPASPGQEKGALSELIRQRASRLSEDSQMVVLTLLARLQALEDGSGERRPEPPTVAQDRAGALDGD